MNYHVYINPIPSGEKIQNPITVEADDMDFDPNGAIEFYRMIADERKTCAAFNASIWNMVTPG
jgi:hypothetical protein